MVWSSPAFVGFVSFVVKTLALQLLDTERGIAQSGLRGLRELRGETPSALRGIAQSGLRGLRGLRGENPSAVVKTLALFCRSLGCYGVKQCGLARIRSSDERKPWSTMGVAREPRATIGPVNMKV